jgi:uncharacterized membrane protein
MKQNQFRIILFLIVMFMGALLSFSFSIGNPILAAGIFLAGAAIIYLFKSRVEGVMEDERIRQVSQKASWVTYQIIVLSFSIGGVVLISMRNTYPLYADLGFFLAYACCGILVLYSLFYTYFNREYGG